MSFFSMYWAFLTGQTQGPFLLGIFMTFMFLVPLNCLPWAPIYPLLVRTVRWLKQMRFFV